MFILKYNIDEIYDENLTYDILKIIINQKIYNIIEKLEFNLCPDMDGNYIE